MRFATARDVLLAYPQIAIAYQSPWDETPCMEYLGKLLAGGRLADAVAFVAHVLPRRELVWWASKCIRLEGKAFTLSEEPMIEAAERWVRDPNDHLRKEALKLGDAGDAMRAATWIARAAGWSGGVLFQAGDDKIMCQAHMSPAAARAAVLLASAASTNPQAFLERSIQDAKSLLARAAV
jgi:hypothetical protein